VYLIVSYLVANKQSDVCVLNSCLCVFQCRMAAPLILRIKTKHGIETINSLTGASTIAELRSEVSTLTNLSVESIKLLSGYPPKPLPGLDPATTLAELYLKSGETLIAEEDMSARKVQLEKNYHDEVSYVLYLCDLNRSVKTVKSLTL